jgi:hypothetical protein
MERITEIVGVALLVAGVTACALVATGCQSMPRAEVDTALDAVQAAADAARSELPAGSVGYESVDLLDVTLSAARDIRWSDAEGDERLAHYVLWAKLAARAVVSFITILEGAGVDVPEAVTEAREVLARYLR